MRPHAQLDLEHFLPYRLSVLANRVSGTLARAYSQRFGLTVTEWRIMAVLGRYPGLSANELAERTAMDKVAISRAVARLLESGDLLRSFDRADRRRSKLRLSKAGFAIYDLKDVERDTLFTLLDRLDELELRVEASTESV